MKNRTNWYVITGGPSTGKTTVVNLLAEKGYNTAIEHARHYIETMSIGGKTVAEIRENKLEFQQGVLKMQIEQEAKLDPEEAVFLDRAIPDALAYYRFLGLEPDALLNGPGQPVRLLQGADELGRVVEHQLFRQTLERPPLRRHAIEHRGVSGPRFSRRGPRSIPW